MRFKNAASQILVVGLLLSVFTATAFAQVEPPRVPEVDAGTLTIAMSVLSGGLLLIMGRRQHRSK